MAVNGRVHHIGIAAQHLDRSYPFYDAILKELGYRHLDKNEKRSFWVGADKFEILVYQAKKTMFFDREAPGLHHLALQADSRARVEAVYEIAKKFGAEILATPQFFPQYDKDYYATFFLDPDGIKIEVLHMP